MKSGIQKTCLIAILIFSAMLCMQFASAAIYYTPTYANVSENFMLNITISAPANTNISQIIVQDISTIPFTPNLISNSSSINTTNSFFNFTYMAQSRVYSWYNLTNIGTGLIVNGTNQSFTIYLNHSMAGNPATHAFFVCAYNTTNTTRHCDNILGMDQIENTTATIGMNFGFSGYVKNDTGIPQPGTNVSIYEYAMNPNGPPSEIPLISTTTDTNGMFRLWGINGSKQFYKIKLLYNNSVRATLVGPNLPQFPSNMFYPMPPPPGAEGLPMFKKMPVINGSIFYLQPAVTINISAVGNVPAGNGSDNKEVKFGYEVIDQAVGFPIESNIRNGVWNKEVIVPAGRSYTIMAVRDPITFAADDWCFNNGVPLMNATACPSPPKSMEVTSTNLTNEAGGQGGIINITINLSYSMQYLSGCINLYGNSTLVNLTKVITRLVPWVGFVPPMDAKISDFDAANGSDNLVYGDARCAGWGTWSTFYNVSLMGSGGAGISYLMEFYAKNASNESANGTVGLAAFQNVTMNEEKKWVNVTMYPLTGQYVLSSGANTTKMKIIVQNSSGAALTTNMHVEVKVKNPVFGTMHYIIEDISSGVFYLPILNNSNWAKVSVFPNEAPPVEKTLDLTAAYNNVTVQVGDMTFRRPKADGTLESINVSQGKDGSDTSSSITMSFYRNAAGCNTPNPTKSTDGSDCLLTQMNANDFNPMAVMMAGKVNLELRMNASNTTLYFINFDLLSAKPPTNSIMDNNASSSSANAQSWEQGSFVPHVYDYAFVVMPYSVTSGDANYINESYSSFTMKIPHFRDENWGTAWNTTNGSTTASLPEDYADYNTGAYASLLTTTGAACSETNITAVCYWDMGNNSFILKVPHFSGVGSSITGTAPAATPAAATTDTGSSGSGTTEKAVSESHTFANVNANAENTYRISDPNTIGINSVLFTATEDLANVKITVTKLAGKPSSVSESPEGGIYRWFEIEAPLLNDKTKEAKIQFEVTKKWLEDNNINAEKVRLARYADSKWRLLTTEKISENSNKFYFEAISPGFSYFAVVGFEEEVPVQEEEEAVPKPAENLTTEDMGKAIVEQETAKISKTTLFIVIGVLLLIMLAVFGYRKKHLLIFWREPTDAERQQYIRGEFLSRKKQQSFGSGRD